MRSGMIFAATLVLALTLAAGLALAAESSAVVAPPKPAADAKPQEVPVLQQWQGLYPINQVNLLPEGQKGTPTGFIVNPKTFEAVWKAWKGGQKAPAVDFQKNLVVFSRNVQYLNVIHIGPVLIKDGVVEVLGMETMSAIPIEDKCHMAMAVISREGVKAVKAGEATVTIPLSAAEAPTPSAPAADGGKIDVRPLAFKPFEDDFYGRFGGLNTVTTLENAEALQMLIGKASAKQLEFAVDFGKEKIVLVSWVTGGPPEGVLKHEIKGEGKDRQVVFYIQGPVGITIRGDRAMLCANFFAVPKGVKVTLDPKERF